MSWNLTLMWAERAVKYTASKMTIGASNKKLDLAHLLIREGDSNWGVKELNKKRLEVFREIFYERRMMDRGLKRYRNQKDYAEKKITKLAETAENTGRGNCAEQAAIAFQYLIGPGRETGVAYMRVTGAADHAFVVLGLQSKPPDEEKIRYGGPPPESWGNGAVVCDPWYHEWFVVTPDWPRKSRSIFKAAKLEHTTLTDQITQLTINCDVYT